jgi:purine-nucleoside phosphorylase
MEGRCHLYEGYGLAQVCFPVRVLAALGIQALIVTNAAGGLNPDFSLGDVMRIDDHINLLGIAGTFRCAASFPERQPRPHTRLYDRELAQRAEAIARRADFPLRQGVYVAVSGPTYETRAEYRAFRRIGGDCVGMSTVPEVLTAVSLGVRVLGLSTITNVACPDAPKIVSSDEVVAVAATALPRVRQLLRGLLSRVGQPRTS